jgi:hypothetical protein
MGDVTALELSAGSGSHRGGHGGASLVEGPLLEGGSTVGRGDSGGGGVEVEVEVVTEACLRELVAQYNYVAVACLGPSSSARDMLWRAERICGPYPAATGTRSAEMRPPLLERGPAEHGQLRATTLNNLACTYRATSTP